MDELDGRLGEIEIIVCYGGVSFEGRIASLPAIDEEIIEWLEQRERCRN